MSRLKLLRTHLYILFKIMPRVPIASEDERKFIVEGIQVGRVSRILTQKRVVALF